jgi:hypothetical protein
MPKQIDAINIEVHSEATELARNYIIDFATALLLEAKNIAFNKRASIVLDIDVEEALSRVTKKRKDSWAQETGLIIGSSLFGAFVQGFVSEVSAGNTLLIVTYTLMGFIGLGIVFWSLRR